MFGRVTVGRVERAERQEKSQAGSKHAAHKKHNKGRDRSDTREQTDLCGQTRWIYEETFCGRLGELCLFQTLS